ncbi:hypothetical protein GCM10011339_44940 [Echinicola rosea]|uniref:Uncharacterized protein n=1 Tax=Echinicola rosea TaxID=1807691 RepID=A0ABQ1VDM8_9BACT|nr:hypothetical protein GCM10011339_44940 [Echinicola rosea]
MEVLDHLITAYDLEYMDENSYLTMRLKFDELINKLNAFYKFQIKRSSNLKDEI